MSIEMCIALEATGIIEDAPEEMHTNKGEGYGYDIGYCLEALENISRQLSLPVITQYIYDEELLWDYVDEHGLEDDYIYSHGDWFDPQQAVTSVTRLREYIANNPESLRNYEAGGVRRNLATLESRRDGLLWDLKAMEIILRNATIEGKRFRFVLSS